MPSRAGTASRRDEIALAALALADAEGVAAVTMRRVAERVGIPTMTLYGTFRTKGELLDAMADAAVVAEEITADGDGWRERLTSLMDGVRRALAAHPSGVHLRETGPVLGPAALRVSDEAIQILTEAGFTHRDAAFAYRTIFLFTFGHAAFNAGPDDDGARRRLRAALVALPPDEYPALSTEVDDFVDAASGDEAFRFGLGLVLDGLEALRRA